MNSPATKFFLSLSMLGAAAGSQTPEPVGGEFQVNTYTSYGQYQTVVASDDRGDLVAVWTSDRQDGDGAGIFGQRFNRRGSPRGPEFQINTQIFFQQVDPAIAADRTGNFVVVWVRNLQDASGINVVGQRFNAAGIPQGGEFQINTYTTQTQEQPVVAADSAGNFVVVWGSYGQDGESYGVFGQRFNSAGDALGGEFQVNTYTTDFQIPGGVAVDNAGNFVVVWRSQLQDGTPASIYARRYDAAGDALGGEFQVNTYTTGYQTAPTVAADSAGNFVVVWQSYLQDGSNYSVFAQRYDSLGDSLGGEFKVNTYTTSYQVRPQASMDAAGEFVVVWASLDQDGESYGVFGQWFDSLGSPQGVEFQVNSHTSGSQGRPAVAAHSSGNFVVVWDSDFQDGSYGGVFGQRFGIPIFLGGMESGDFSGWSSVFPPPGP